MLTSFFPDMGTVALRSAGRILFRVSRHKVRIWIDLLGAGSYLASLQRVVFAIFIHEFGATVESWCSERVPNVFRKCSERVPNVLRTCSESDPNVTSKARGIRSFKLT